MINQNMDGRDAALQESVDLKDRLNKLQRSSYKMEQQSVMNTFEDLIK